MDHFYTQYKVTKFKIANIPDNFKKIGQYKEAEEVIDTK